MVQHLNGNGRKLAKEDGAHLRNSRNWVDSKVAKFWATKNTIIPSQLFLRGIFPTKFTLYTELLFEQATGSLSLKTENKCRKITMKSFVDFSSLDHRKLLST